MRPLSPKPNVAEGSSTVFPPGPVYVRLPASTGQLSRHSGRAKRATFHQTGRDQIRRVLYDQVWINIDYLLPCFQAIEQRHFVYAPTIFLADHASAYRLVNFVSLQFECYFLPLHAGDQIFQRIDAIGDIAHRDAGGDVHACRFVGIGVFDINDDANF